MKFTGKIVHIGDIEVIGQNQFEKRKFVVEEDSNNEYKASLAIDLFKDKLGLIDGYNLWDVVEVSLNVRASYSENTQRYYNGIRAWSIKKVSNAPQEEDEHF